MLAAASFVCRRVTSGSTNLPDVGVAGTLASLPAFKLNLSVDRERERSRGLSGRMGEGAARLLIDEDGVVYIETGRARLWGAGEGEGWDSLSLSTCPMNFGAVRPERRAALLPIVSSLPPVSDSSVVSSEEVEKEIGEVDIGMEEKSREALRERGVAGRSASRSRARSEADIMGPPSATV